jgi:GGDEF domain-containing protein
MEKLRYISFHDALTGLYNPAYFGEEMDRLDSSR